MNAVCEVINHSPICSCRPGHTGDPFSRCYPVPRKKNLFVRCLPIPLRAPLKFTPCVIYCFLAPEVRPVQHEPVDPCVPSPCGPYSECRAAGETPSCSCRPNYVGSPPNCKPECVINQECPSDMACIRERCRDPCPGSCGFSAQCSVVNHTPICTCPAGFTGDPFSSCHPEPPPSKKNRFLMRLLPLTGNPIGKSCDRICAISVVQAAEPVDPCDPSPCGPNARCDNGVCSCLAEYQGDPYYGCRPECVLATDCPKNEACVRNRCKDPCVGTCGEDSVCTVLNHIPICSCPERYSGNPFISCKPVKGTGPIDDRIEKTWSSFRSNFRRKLQRGRRGNRARPPLADRTVSAGTSTDRPFARAFRASSVCLPTVAPNASSIRIALKVRLAATKNVSNLAWAPAE